MGLGNVSVLLGVVSTTPSGTLSPLNSQLPLCPDPHGHAPARPHHRLPNIASGFYCLGTYHHFPHPSTRQLQTKGQLQPPLLGETFPEHLSLLRAFTDVVSASSCELSVCLRLHTRFWDPSGRGRALAIFLALLLSTVLAQSRCSINVYSPQNIGHQSKSWLPPRIAELFSAWDFHQTSWVQILDLGWLDLWPWRSYRKSFPRPWIRDDDDYSDSNSPHLLGMLLEWDINTACDIHNAWPAAPLLLWAVIHLPIISHFYFSPL